MPTEPSSAIHLTGWLTVIAVALICVFPTGNGVRNTFYYKYRPASQPYINPGWSWFFWTSALVLLGVSFVYLLTLTSNTGNWANRLFPNASHPWDVMVSLYLVTAILIKMWNPFVYWLDDQWIYWNGRTTLSGVYNELASRGANVPSRGAARAKAAGGQHPVGSDTTDSLWEKHDMYFVTNWLVQGGMIIYSGAVVALLATITGFYSRLYAEQKNDQTFKIIYWTMFVAFFVSVFGLVYVFFVCFYYKYEKEREKDLKAIVDQRNLENQVS
jgi:formate hydrogenlyase subunit 3/multisubunit Na+/H+ antiporter MnhD subunit